MKLIGTVGVVLAAMSMGAVAQTCDLEGAVSVTYAGAPDSKGTAVAYGISMAEIERLHKRALRVVDTASKLQDQGGEYAIEFDETRRCSGTVSKGAGVAGVMVQGLTFRGMNKVAREFDKQVSDEIGIAEKRASQGKRRALGRD